MQKTQIRSMVQEDPTCCRAAKPMCHNYWACTLAPGNCNYWAQKPQLLKPACPRACALQQEKPPHWEAHISQLEKSLPNNQDPAQPKINKIIKNKFSPFKKYNSEDLSPCFAVIFFIYLQILTNPSYHFMDSALYKDVILVAWDPAPYSANLNLVSISLGPWPLQVRWHLWLIHNRGKSGTELGQVEWNRS